MSSIAPTGWYLDKLKSVPLIALAVAHSGDKGDVSNIAVICRSRTSFKALDTALTAQNVRGYIGHMVEGDVRRYTVPGVHAYNFVLDRALSGGSSLPRNDALGKAFAQILLPTEVMVDADLGRMLQGTRPAT